MTSETDFDRGVREGKLRQIETGVEAMLDEFLATWKGRDCRHGKEARNAMGKSTHELHEDQVASGQGQTAAMENIARQMADEDYKFFFKATFADMLSENEGSIDDIVKQLLGGGDFQLKLIACAVIASAAEATMAKGLERVKRGYSLAAMAEPPEVDEMGFELGGSSS